MFEGGCVKGVPPYGHEGAIPTVIEVEVNPLEKHLNEVINPAWNFAGRCESFEDHVQNAILGLVGEAGETADQVKKWLYHQEKADGFHEEKLKSELGDVIYYWTKLVELLGFSVAEVLANNRAKLESRHPELGKVNTRFGEGYVR